MRKIVQGQHSKKEDEVGRPKYVCMYDAGEMKPGFPVLQDVQQVNKSPNLQERLLFLQMFSCRPFLSSYFPQIYFQLLLLLFSPLPQVLSPLLTKERRLR